MKALRIAVTALRLVLRGGAAYWAWIAFLAALIAWGGLAYADQFRHGLIVTNMRDQVSWAFYIGNFTFLVGVAAAAVVLVIPAYVYDWGPLKEVAILGEMLAISAIVMCFLFVTADMGHPERFWHMIPGIGKLNLPRAILAWDVVVLNGYLLLNVGIVTYVLGCGLQGKHYNPKIVHPFFLLSVPAALSIHTVTAFIYSGMAGRPYWNSAILAPRFICSAFCSGPAIMLVVFQVLQRTTRIRIKDEAIWKVAELMAYAMFLNLFMLGAEVFTEAYAGTEHLVHLRYLFFGVEGHRALVPFAWTFVACGVVAFLLLLVPRTRKNPITLNVGCLLIYTSVYIEKGMGIIIPAYTPDTLGEIYEYTPTLPELRIGAGIFGVGFLVFTILSKIAIPIMTGEFEEHHRELHGAPASPPEISAPSGPGAALPRSA
jgi:molybdopterin-containing oxidoreductase family membrane subunit